MPIFSKVRLGILILTVCLTAEANAQGSGTVVKTTKGYVRGLNENGILVFKGVPYAAPPVGSLRFMPPVEHAVWPDTLAATKFGAMATQPAGKKVEGQEDCLFLNLYTPAADNHKRAVVVWIHGGSMTNGAGMGSNGHAFADKDDIVTITINYRLGALGFLYMGDVDKRYAASGNCGLLDVVMALKWIKQNITQFGGDPNQVTIMGESAGAKLLSAVMVAPASKRLFQQIIAESGSVQCIRDTVTAKNERLRLLRQLGLGPDDAAKLLNLPADSLVKAQGIICKGIGGNSQFGPVYDGSAIIEDAYKYAASKNVPRIKALIGTNEYEGAAFTGKNDDYSHPDSTIFRPLFGTDHALVYATYQQKLKTDSPYAAAVKVLTQYMYQVHSYRFAKVLAQNGIMVYMYRFTYSDSRQFGASHGAELHYLWNGHNADTATVKNQLEANMHGAWVAFIKTGNPNIALLPQWPNYNDSTRQVMDFDAVDKVISLKEVFNDKNFPSQVFRLN